MSSIGNVGSSLSLAMSQAAERGQRPQGVGQGPPQPSAEMKAKFEAQFKSKASELGIDVSQFESLKTDIDAAVQTALDGFDGMGDPKEAVDAAVSSVLEEKGIDPVEFKSQMESIFSSMGMPKPGAGGFGGGPQGGDLSALLGSSYGKNSSNEMILELLKNLPSGSLVDAEA